MRAKPPVATTFISYKGDYIGIREMRKHAAWYTRGLPGSAQLREQFNRADTRDAFVEILHEAGYM